MRWPSWMPGRDVDLERSRSLDTCAAAARTSWHGCSTIAPRPRAVGARLRADELAEARCATPAAGGRCRRSGCTRRGCVPGSTPSPPHVAHGDGHLERHLHLRAASPPRRARSRSRADVGAAPPPPRAAAEDVVAEERREEVAEPAQVEVRRLEAARAQALRGRSGRRARASRSSRAPRTPRSPRGSAAPRPARSRRRDAAGARGARNAFLIVASSASRATPSSS